MRNERIVIFVPSVNCQLENVVPVRFRYICAVGFSTGTGKSIGFFREIMCCPEKF